MHPKTLEALIDTARLLAEKRTLNTLLEFALASALELFEAEQGYIFLLDANDQPRLRLGCDRSGAPLQQPQVSQTILEGVIRSQQELLSADALLDKRLQSASSVIDLQLRSVVCIPLAARGRPLGALYLENRLRGGIFSSDDLPALRLFAAQLAVAVDNAALNENLEARVAERTAELRRESDERELAQTLLHEQERLMAGVEERRRLGADLHDSLGQTLAYTGLMAERLQKRLQAGELPAATDIAREVREMVSQANQQLRLILAGMRADDLAGASFFEALEEYLRRYSQVTGIQAELHIQGFDGPDQALPWCSVGTAVQMLGIVQEALANIRRHSAAQRAWVRCERQTGLVLISISDNGAGFNPQLPPVEGHFGLQIMHERAQQIGGQLRVRSEPGQGTTITIVLPLVR